MIYEAALRPLLFAISQKDPEIAHRFVLRVMGELGKVHPFVRLLSLLMTFHDPKLEQKVFGLIFPNPVGLAAGFDKNAEALRILAALGFGYLEAGTITALQQDGNPRPRIWRFSEDRAMINTMGFNNDGADVVAARLEHIGNIGIPIGISIGKSRIVDPEDLHAVIQDHLYSLKLLYYFADYLVVNVSSPNTPGLRNLQGKKQLSTLLTALIAEATRLSGQATRKPILVKTAPDLEWPALDELLQVCSDHGIDGLIAGNTTLSRDGLTTRTDVGGGLSGKPLFLRALKIVSYIHQQAPSLPVIAAGGISTADDAKRMLDAGAVLLQILTGFVYGGPATPSRINKDLLSLAT
ncbi:quinone-dependent dihydroorotate dehydrogenase [Patescibacteria group bacterium]|nr:quinone-dependent dihydroorotate dehydrogenase [Patescibacteria group bacterium]